MAEGVDRIRAIRDPGDRLRAATEEIAAMQRDLDALGRIRREAVGELRARGLTYAEIAAAAGVTRGRTAPEGQ